MVKFEVTMLVDIFVFDMTRAESESFIFDMTH